MLNKVGNDILGQVGAVTYFTISVDGNGVVTFTQSLNIWHGDTSSHDDFETLTLSDPALLQLTVTDADGDTASAALNLGAGVFTIEDDGPAVIGAVSSGTVDEDGVIEDAAAGTSRATASLAGLTTLSTRTRMATTTSRRRRGRLRTCSSLVRTSR